MDDSDAEAWNNLGIVYYRMKDYPEALAAYERAVQLEPGFASAFNNQGTLYLRMALERKDREVLPKAIAAFDRAIGSDPSLASAYNGRASAFKFSGRPQDAIRDWKKALELQPDFVDVYFNLGITYLETGEKSEALSVLNLCKKRFYSRLPVSEQGRLDRLIDEAIR
jgi:tetratricopeptide (TPR) repeat protein